jgi:uncharacterized protein YgbK (DUF1537 family)
VLYTYYGDDFTGSTDVLESLALAGVESVLFLRPPTPQHLQTFSHCQAIGIAGESRSRTPEWMSSHLPRIFTILKSFNAPITHYKTCSTFDSSPTRGNIGRAIEIGRTIFDPEFAPIVVAAPHLGRYVLFGNLYATAGNETYRIDLHPTMSRHPVTPMTEPNLRKHLAAQTQLPIALLDIRDLTSANPEAALDTALHSGAQAILFDGLDEATLATTGKLLWSHANNQPLFAGGSSGLTESLVTEWRSQNLIPSAPPAPKPTPVDQVLVISGSCSPATAAQIQWALDNGFSGIPLDPEKLTNPSHAATTAATAISQTLAQLAQGRSVILYTALGPLTSNTPPHGDQLGTALGNLLRHLLAQSPSPIRRIILCGGDTSSHTVQQLGLYALTWSASLDPGAPLCLAHSDDESFRNMEFVLKGGQIGAPDFFALARAGGL